MTTSPGQTAAPLAELFDRLTIPVIAAPMTAVSTPELVGAACASGVIGAFPSGNCRSVAELDEWLDQIAALGGPHSTGLVAVNLIVHRSNERLAADLACVARRQVPLVITSVGNPVPVIGPLHAAGCRVLVDVASLEHARKALAAGADGLVLLSAGAGGHTGWANPLAFGRAVRRSYDGPLVLAGGVSDGTALWAAITLGYDLGYLGTKLIATAESGANDAWRQGVIDGSLDDIVLATAPNGIPASLLRAGGGSAGHSISGVDRLTTVAKVIGQTRAEWDEARARTRRALDRTQ